MNSRIALLAVTTLALAGAGCSKSDDTAAASDGGNAVFNTAMSSVSNQMKEFDDLLPNNEGASSIQGLMRVQQKSDDSDRVHTTAAFGTAWDQNSGAVLSNPRCSGGSSTICSTPVTPKQWMGYQLDPAAVRENGSNINVFGRFTSAVQISCAIMNLMTVDATTGYPSDGTQEITFSSAATSIMVNKCGFAADQAPTEGTITAVVTTPTDTTYYDRKITMTLPANMDGGTQSFYMRVNASAVNIATGETNSHGQSRTLVALDRTTNVLRVEYYSGGSTTSGGFNLYRLYYDKTNDVGRMFGYEADGSDSGGIRYTLAGKPTAGTEAALSMDLKGWGSGATWDKNYKACVTMADGTIATDNSLSCAGSITGTDIDDANLATMYNDAFTNRAVTGWVNNIGETTSLTFTDTTVFSALASH